MAAFMVYLVIISKKQPDAVEETVIKKMPVWKMILFIILGGAGIVGGSQLTVNAATSIAKFFGMSERLIGLTIVAFGTSLPELVTSVVASYKHNADIAIGNIVGSNIFNILFVLGVTAVITPIAYVNDFIVDNIMAMFVMLLLFLCVIRHRKLTRLGGIIMLLCYAAYNPCSGILYINSGQGFSDYFSYPYSCNIMHTLYIRLHGLYWLQGMPVSLRALLHFW